MSNSATAKQILEETIRQFSPDKLTKFFREKNRTFVPRQESLSHYNDENFSEALKIGEIPLEADEKLTICSFKSDQPLSERSGKKAQYDQGKRILKETQSDAGIFIFCDPQGHFRFSLIYPETIGNRRQWSHFRRFTYFVSREFTNKTFLQRIGEGDFGALEKVKEAFALGPVTDIFYKDFFVEYSKLVEMVKERDKLVEQQKARDFVLLFAIRTIFLGFIQKKRWIGNDEKFMQNFFKEYRKKYSGQDLFYKRWLTPLFFQALNSSPGKKVAYSNNDFSEETEQSLQMAPYLNGGLFKEKPEYDHQGYFIPDKGVEDFFDFLFSHNFTIEENSYEDEDLQLNPEFLGIIFERLVSKTDGTVYTPRTEVDLMCRLSLVKWLFKNTTLPIPKSNLYELFFREGSAKEDQKHGSFSEREIKEILHFLESITICDPAVGSGAFLVGMMQVLDEVEQSLKTRIGLKDSDSFERKKRIIVQSLYGVEVKEWAVWICQLRLWLSLFIEAPDEMKNSFEPILPSLDFKVRQGDSLVQRVGSKLFPVLGHANLPSSIKSKVTQLKNLKVDFFQNKTNNDWEIRYKETAVFREILQSEIGELQKQREIFKDPRPGKQMDFYLPDSGEKEEQITIDFNQQKVAKLEAEITELKQELSALCEDKPLIWNIEFAEIFVESGGFDIVIGNPPYIRQEEISDPFGKAKDKKQYKEFLAEMVRMDFPHNFSPKTKINAQSDIYTYFYMRALRLLNPKGIHTFICSNSWLDVGYGLWLQKFLLDQAPVEWMIDNHAKRSFESADVNTIISIIHAPVKKISPDHLVKFIAFKKPFEELVFTEYLLQIEEAKEVVSNDLFRVYPITLQALKNAGTEYESEEQAKMQHGTGTYIGDKWGGKYLRAPDIFFKILEKGKDKLVRLGDIAEVRFGIKTGANEFFYLDEEKIKQWGIEEEFLRAVIVSPRECKSILIRVKELEKRVLWCQRDRKSLRGTNTLKYIEWGESKNFHRRPTCNSRESWWNLGNSRDNEVIWAMIHAERHNVHYNKSRAKVDHNFFEIISRDEVSPCIMGAIATSTFCIFVKELLGRTYGGGSGPIKNEGVDLEKFYFLNPVQLSSSERERLACIFERLYERELRTVFEECGINPQRQIRDQDSNPLSDRKVLDDIIFDILGLNKDERREVYWAVCELVKNRLEKAKSI